MAHAVSTPVWVLKRHLATDSDSHDDFKTKYTTPPVDISVEEQIKQSITSDKVHVFMKV